jgi:urease accessory protein
MITAMTMAPERLHLLQLISPALPVGGFSYSEGLEVLHQRGWLTGPEPLQAWLAAELQGGAIAVETAALSGLMASWEQGAMAELADRDGWLAAQREAPELRAQQRQMGQSLLQLLVELGWPLPCDAAAAAAALGWPAAFARAAVCLGITAPAVQEAYLYSWTANQISAAVRLIPLGPTAGQRLQLQLAAPIAACAAALAAADPLTLWNAGVGAGLAQLQHAELYSRLFRS